MATLKLSSTNKEFSFVIMKNPESGMLAKNIRNGTAFGWYPPGNDQCYCVAFFDGMDEMSFAKGGQNESFSYIDSTKYNSPLFIAAAIREFFHSALSNKEEDKDELGFHNELVISSVEIHRIELFEKLASCFEGFEIKVEELPHTVVEGVEYNNFTLTISTELPIWKLLNLGYLLSYMIAISSHINFIVEKAMLSRLIEAAIVLEAPYYVRHLIRCWCIKSIEEFKRVKEDLDFHERDKFDISPDINSLVRLNWIKSQIQMDTDIVDYGCGEGNFFSISKSISNSTYYAIDRDEETREAATRRMERKEYDNIIILDSLDAFISAETDKDFVVIMSEMFEHNELDSITKDLKKLLDNPHCTRIILTTPNKDFNKYYLLDEGELRIEDHVFEMTKSEAEYYFTELVEDIEFSVKITDLGDKVNDIPTIIGVILKRTTTKEDK